MFSEACRSHFGSMTRSELSDQIRVMGKLMRSYGAEVAVGAFEEALGITGATRCVSSSRFFVTHHPILSGLSAKVFRISPRAAGPSLPSCFPA